MHMPVLGVEFVLRCHALLTLLLVKMVKVILFALVLMDFLGLLLGMALQLIGLDHVNR